MKFGKTLKRTLYQPWADSYLDYKQLKQIINNLVQHSHNRSNATSTDGEYQQLRTEFLTTIHSETSKISTLYLQKIHEWKGELETLCTDIHQQCAVKHVLPSQQSVTRFTELCTNLDKLRSFVMLNHLACIKILKKYEKHSGDSSNVRVELLARIMQQPFYSSNELAELLTLATITASSMAAVEYEIEPQSTIAQEEIKKYECGICLTIVNDPVVLSCSHFFCFRCITKAHAIQVNSQQHVCPICRKAQPLHPSSYKINGVLDQFIRTRFTAEYQQAKEERDNLPPTPPLSPEVPPRNSLENQSSHPSEFDLAAPSHGKVLAANNYNHNVWSGHPQPQQPASPDTKLLADEAEQVAAEQSAEHHGMDIDTECAATAAQQSQASSPPTPLLSPAGIQFELPLADINGVKHTERIDTLLHYIHHAERKGVRADQMYFILDIDETIHLNPYQPCMLMTERGLAAYQMVLAQSPLYASVPIAAKNKTTKVLQSALQQKAFVEATSTDHHLTTEETIRKLQAAGCHVFALTARYANQATTTRRELLTLGIDLSISSPFPAACELVDEESGAMYSEGVIYTNATEKGVIFNRFLTGMFQPNSADLIPSLACHHLFDTAPIAPKHIIFIDDRYSNCVSVMHDLEIARQMDITLDALHYTFTHNKDANDDLGSETFDIEVVQCQVHHFICTNEILNDKSGRELLRRCKLQKQRERSGSERTPSPVSPSTMSSSAMNGKQSQQSNGLVKRSATSSILSVA